MSSPYPFSRESGVVIVMAVPCATTSNASVNPMLTFQFQFLFSCFIPNVKRNEMILSRYPFLKLYILFSVNKLYHVTKKKKIHLTLLYLKFLPYHSNSKTNQRQETITIIVRLLSQRGESNQNKQSSTDETMDPLRANNDRKPPNNLVNWPPTHAINRHLPNFRKETR